MSKLYLPAKPKIGRGSPRFLSTELKKPFFELLTLQKESHIFQEEAYKAYSSRWEIENVMRHYKNAREFTDTREHSDYSVIGSEFIDFISVLITFKLINKFDEIKLPEKMTYRKAMNVLRRAKKVRINNSWKFVKMNPSQIKILQSLDLIPKDDVWDYFLGK